ncbi:hypothetical protein GLYMA_15G068400v4 [Glycine max]|uniref:Uncharacterized protein n=1 Tax=Glycine max TaxID=3847 RepID=K7MA06_SOYBN|nr:hypothetical protein GYH30_041575 [Glycine max]KRH10766.1 hypothetical protein GLYMA_15G068400v4 [Glycine max]
MCAFENELGVYAKLLSFVNFISIDSFLLTWYSNHCSPSFLIVWGNIILHFETVRKLSYGFS